MMKRNFLLILLGIIVAFSSCKKESDENPVDSTLAAKYNDASVEENKTTIEDNGIEFSQEINDMKDLDAIRVAINAVSMLEDNNLINESPTVAMSMAPISVLSAIGSNTSSSKSISDKLKSASEDPENLEEAWLQIVGTYEYNFTTEEFDQTAEGGNAVIIKFPGLESDNTNTGQIKVNNFNYFEITAPISSDNEEDISLVGQQLPTNIHTELSYEETILATWDFSASYQSNGLPTNYSSILTISSFSFSSTFSHSPYSKATSKFSFKKGSKILLETYSEMNGNWSEENIDNNVETVTEEYEYYTDEYTMVYFENIINNANAYFQILNIKIAGKVDFKALVPKIRNLEDQYDNEEISQKEYTNQMVKLINENAKLVVVTANENEMIAKAEAYSYYDDEDYEWDASIKFIFGDGSSIDADTYIANENYKDDFGGLIDEINNMIDDFNAEYETDIANIE